VGCDGYRPSSGEIIFDGKIINDLPVHERARLGITMAWLEPVRFECICVADYFTLRADLFLQHHFSLHYHQLTISRW